MRSCSCLAHNSEIKATSESFARVTELPAVRTLARRLEDGGVLSCTGISAAAQGFLAVLLHRLSPQRPVVVVAEGLRSQEGLHQDISTWLAHGGRSDAPPLFYPAWETFPREARLPHVDVISERLETLVSLAEGWKANAEAPIIVTNVIALMQRTFSRDTMAGSLRALARGDRLNPLDLVDWLEGQGYEAEAQVTQKGELAVRGGIVDLFPLTSPWPVRLEFFGDELESLRHFDPLTQISREEIAGVTIPPAGELGLLKQGRDSDSRTDKTLKLGTLLDYLPPRTVLLLCEPKELDARAEEYAAGALQRQAPAEQSIPKEDGKANTSGARDASTESFFIPWDQFQRKAEAKGVATLIVTEEEAVQEIFAEAALQPSPSPPPAGASPPPALATIEHLRMPHLEAFRPLAERAPEPQVIETQRREFFAQLHRWLRQGYAVHVFCNNDGERQRFSEIWEEYGLDRQLAASDPPAADSKPTAMVEVHLGTLGRGFLCDASKLVDVTDAEIFGRYKVQRPRRLKSPHAQATRSALDIDFTDLEEGDYVVHLQHGIGRYVGLQVLPIGAGTKPTELASATSNSAQECLVIEYAPNDPAQPPPKLYVPVTEAHLVSKYVGTGKARPPLNTLGGTRWAKAKAQAARAVRDVASDLLAIQAARETQLGHAFTPDTPWQREFESAFLFEETPDQMRAILETKGDMERPKPMDRLICGDVGFGKTEVGIRAAFKAVMDGRQVAVLVPTTVLAQQHFNTFRERMADYPVRIELLSRFRTRRAQQKVVKDLAAGAVDIVIGTHRLLQNDIAFKDLGLVVIDEEQRFGVMHKEGFKRLRQLVDVLTLSATPIPRTLYLALTGARDMSTIQTPPHDRLPVETIVTQYDERVIREAIQRELNRGGQVFFLHNRVMTIDTVAQKLRALLPQARIVVGHGQMHSDDLEEIMTQFVNGEADILLSTTIIESGLDIPNANTIIIDRADRFGLSDLYQLRGRVGRYKHQAYAYLLLPRHGGLLSDVRKRLSAIKQYSTLGSGFKIAMRDLEIRGAGNLLGAEQSGHITAVGFELYCQLLKQSVASQKGEKVSPRIEVQVRLDFLALSPMEEASISTPRVAGSRAAAALADGEMGAEAEIPTRAAVSRQAATNTAAQRPQAAYIPFNYITDARQRIEVYRKVAQASDNSSIEGLERELRDRFGPLPPAMQLLLEVAGLKILAAERGVTVIEVKEDKLMLTRNNDYLMVGSKFPRLTRKGAPARLKEIRRLLLAL